MQGMALWIEGILSVLAGVLILLRPQRFYLLAAGYLFLRAVTGIPHLTVEMVIAAAVGAALIIFLPRFLAYIFGGYLIVIAGLMTWQSGFSVAVSVTLLAAALLFILPDLVAWVIGLYLTLTGLAILLPKLGIQCGILKAFGRQGT